MFNVIRRLRRALLQGGLYREYFKYAVGEIVLVVVGILIALQLNNWNEGQKAREDERSQLLSLREELQTSLVELEEDYRQSLGFLEATLNVYEVILTRPPPDEFIYRDFYRAIGFNYFFPKTSIYETLKSGGLQRIRSDAVRTAITDVYETGYQRILMKVDTRRNASRVLFPYYQTHFRTRLPFERDSFGWKDLDDQLGVPVDYDYVINDPQFETLIAEAIHGRMMNKYDLENALDYLKTCLAVIEQYLSGDTASQ